MTNAQQDFTASHQNLMQLLPWYVNKTLKGQELLAVEKHLSTCLVCKRELTQLEKLARSVVHESSFDSAEKASFARLKHRLHSTHESVQQRHVENDEHVIPIKTRQKSNIFKSWLHQPVWAIAATVVLALLVPFSISQDQSGFVNHFRTLSNAETESLNPNEIRVVFADKVDVQQKNIILQRIQGQIVDNPTDQGVYTIQLTKDIAANQLLTIVEQLRKDQNVVFAEPAYAFLSVTHNKEDKQ